MKLVQGIYMKIKEIYGEIVELYFVNSELFLLPKNIQLKSLASMHKIILYS